MYASNMKIREALKYHESVSILKLYTIHDSSCTLISRNLMLHLAQTSFIAVETKSSYICNWRESDECGLHER